MGEEYKDRKASLIIFGILEILGGLFCMLMAVVTLLSMAITPEEISMSQMMPGVMFYVFFSVWLVWMGIGTIRARRWARLLMLASSWLALICGVVAMGVMLYMLPKIYEAMNLPAAAATMGTVVTMTVLVIFYLLIPGIGVLFYGSRNIRATFEHADTKSSWTEQCPLPVLTLSLLLVFFASSVLLMGFMNFTTLFFGFLLSGWQGAVVQVTLALVFLILAFWTYRLRVFAWWAVLGLLVLGLASQLLTFGQLDIVEFYRTMGYSDRYIQTMHEMSWMDPSMFGVMSLLYAVPGFIYLLLIKRYFRNRNPGE